MKKNSPKVIIQKGKQHEESPPPKPGSPLPDIPHVLSIKAASKDLKRKAKAADNEIDSKKSN